MSAAIELMKSNDDVHAMHELARVRTDSAS